MAILKKSHGGGGGGVSRKRRNGAQILRRSEVSSFIVCGNGRASGNRRGCYCTIVIRRVVFID